MSHHQSQTMSPSPDRKMILWNEYEVEELIGGGSFGHVYSCRHLKTGKYYAVKKFKTKF
jgi:serine/threonine protein kinase